MRFTMDLSRGICILCSNSTKVIFPPQAEHITNFLCEILENYIDVRKFDETRLTLKVCTLCLHDILQVMKHRKKMDEFSEDVHRCSICQDKKNLVSITDWGHFDTLLENINARRKKRCMVCLHCIKYLEILKQFKVHFLKKYPHLELTEFAKDKLKVKSNKSLLSQSKKRHPSDSKSEVESVSKTRHTSDLKSALKHLKPLKYSSFNTDHCKGDSKLLKQVAFVKLSISNLSKKHEMRQIPKRSRKQRSLPLSDSDSSGETSPRHSFFKIRLNMNANKAKAHKVSSGKVTKPKNKSKIFSSKKKELFVKIIKMDLKELKQETDILDSDDESPSIRTPTKASQKMMPEDSWSSSRKRKSVTFAEDLNVEIIDGESSRKDNTDGTPLKSSLKKSNSPTSDIFQNGSAENSSDEDSNLVSDIIKKIQSDEDSDHEMDASKSYVKEIQKNNDNIFNSLKESDKCMEEASMTESTKRKNNLVNSESEDDEKLSGNEKQKKRKYSKSSDSEESKQEKSTSKRIKTSSDFEDNRKTNSDNTEAESKSADNKKISTNNSSEGKELEENNSDEEVDIAKDKDDENGDDSVDAELNITNKKNNSRKTGSDLEDEEVTKSDKGHDQTHDKSTEAIQSKNGNKDKDRDGRIENEDGDKSDTEAEDTQNNTSRNGTEEHIQEDGISSSYENLKSSDLSNGSKSKEFSHTESAVSTSSDSSKEDTMIPLGEYKKMRKSFEGNDPPDSGQNYNENNLDSTTLSEIEKERDDLEEKDKNNEKLNISRTNSFVKETESRMEENSPAKSNKDDIEKLETIIDKVSDNEIDKNEIQTNTSTDKAALLLPEVPTSDEQVAASNEPITVGNHNTISDSENIGFGGEETGP